MADQPQQDNANTQDNQKLSPEDKALLHEQEHTKHGREYFENRAPGVGPGITPQEHRHGETPDGERGQGTHGGPKEG